MLGLLFGFLVGVLAVLAAEAVALLAVLDWLRRKKKPEPPGAATLVRDLDGEQSLAHAYNKKGVVWLLESGKVPRATSDESSSKVLKEQKARKGIVEVSPTKKYAKIKDHSLILVDVDGSQEKTTIQLMDCIIVAVSASDLSSRKWAKRYPIRVESKNSVIYKGSKTFYLFLETSWEKEAWCKALRLASCTDTEKLKWYKLSEDFHRYLASLHAGYPSLMKPSELFGEARDRTSKNDASSKVRDFLKKIAKKASKSGAEHKLNLPSSNRGENRFGERSRTIQDVTSSTFLTKTSLTEKSSSSSLQDLVQPTTPTFSHSASQSQASVSSDLAGNEKLGVDEGSVCWNLLFSRMFFDAKRSTNLNRYIKERIQRSLSNMRTPSYVGGITCTRLDLGDLPPYIRSMKVLPMDLNEAWAFEVDIEYSGGIILDIETRLEVCEPDFQKGLVGSSLEPNTAGEVTADLLEGFEHYGDQLKHATDSTDRMENKIQDDKPDGLKQSKSASWTTTYVSRWKAIVNSIAEQVSQVPLSLAIRIASLRGTLRLHIKPPPSDRLWFGFTSMPEIDWNLDSSVGDHKITSGRIALLIGSRFKAGIQESLVLPNCESICIPWMLAEKDDWVPRNVAPLIWVRHEVADLPVDDASNFQSGESIIKLDSAKGTQVSSVSVLQDDVEKRRGFIYSQPTHPEPVQEVAFPCSAPVTSASSDQTTGNNVEDLKKPLLRDEDIHDSCSSSEAASPDNLLGTIVPVEQKTTAFEDDTKSKRMGRRARMLDLGKKMGEKLEEKRRHIEERGRHIVEKMRENSRT
uniref:Testis-expressed sequence 2 protein n=1 Tax=Anthurium amnicola TaxID=1678845 RepID=A0A1D1Z7G6_9ARAE